jgi:diguanylate cyclase (GGDEF)-like protein/PAS domain S-box-containing protein
MRMSRASVHDYARFMDTVPDAALLINRAGAIVRGNELAQRMFAGADNALEGLGVDQLVPSEVRDRHAGHMQHFWQDAQQCEMGAGGQLMARRLDGNRFPIDIMLSPVDLAEGQFVVCMMRDQTRQIEQQRRLREALEREQILALTDPLTGAANTRHLDVFLRHEIENARRNGRPFTLIYMDLDHFKSVNERGGHSEGDRALCRITETASESLRATDLLARVGGDEFVIVLPEADQSAARNLVSRLLDHLSTAMQSAGWPITFSLGVVTFTSPPPSSFIAIRQADNLMFEVKNAGRNACRYAQSTQ